VKLSSAIQEALVALLCYDNTPGGGRFVRGLLEAKVFDPYFQDIVADAHAFVDKYDAVPGAHTLDLIQALCARKPDSKDIFERIFQSLEETKETINRDYVLSQAQSFARYQRMRQGLSDAIQALKADDETCLDEADSILEAARKSTNNLFDPGIRITDTERSLEFLTSRMESFPLMIPQLDNLGLGPARGRLITLAAASGRGKSWWLVHLGKMCAVLSRLKVCHITLELMPDEVCGRYMQSLFAITKRNEVVYRKQFQADELGRFIDMADVAIKNQPYLRDDGIASYIRNRVKNLTSKPQILVKGFPMGSLTMRQLIAYLDALQANSNFIPDVLIVDYPDHFSIDPKNTRLEVGQIYKQLKGLATARNMAIAVVTQMNRDGGSAKVGRAQHVAESAIKVDTSDVFMTFNQTDGEHALGLARLFVEKGRSDTDRFTVLISQAYALGQFCLDSVKMADGVYWRKVEEEAIQRGEEAT